MFALSPFWNVYVPLPHSNIEPLELGHNDINAIGFNAKDAPNQKGKSAIQMRIRELFAKVKVFMDLL